MKSACMKSRIAAFGMLFCLISCTHMNSIKNERKGTLKSVCTLQEVGQKNFYLDAETAPKPVCACLYGEPSGRRMLTLLNEHNNSIYFYDYDSQNLVAKTHYDKEGPNGILKPLGYCIINMDSIYVYDMMKIEIVLTDSSGTCKQRIPLKTTTDNQWSLYHPQYYFSAVNPIVQVQGKLVLTGFAPFSLPAENLKGFRFSTVIDIHSGEIAYRHQYPEELYGHNYNWEGGYFTMVYPCLLPDGKTVYSFPVSHNLYIYDSHTDDVQVRYGGSNVAGTIRSIDHEQRRTPSEMIEESFLGQDVYGPLLHDPYRKVYYRFLLNAIPNATLATPRDSKELTVIIMDEDFKYLGEQIIGSWKQWNWENAFISAEGLNIEYIDWDDAEEDYLNYKIFVPEKR